MNRIIPAGCLAALFLAGCNSPSQHTPVPRNYGAASDVAVTRHTQYTLWDKGVFSGQLPVSTGSHLLTANSDRLSFDWEGDAIELLNELARVRGMQFNYNGVRLPLPVNLHVRDTDLFSAVMSAYRTQLQNSSYTPPLGTVVSSSEQRMANAQDPKSALSEIMGPLVSLTNRIATETSGTGTTSAQINPLIKMKNIGDITMVSAEGIWTIYTTARVVVAGGKDSILVKFFNSLTGAASMLTALFEALAPPVYFLLFLMFCAGFSLSIYLPFIPFIFWMTGIGNWIVSVLIGCTAGPLWAATHLGTSEDRGSRAAYGYIYLIDSMIRPPIMVFGFFFASVAIIAVGTILNALFGAALVNVQFNSLTGIFSLAGFLLIYARICTTTVAAIFALQAYLPDHVINFLGGRDGANTLGSMANSVKEIFIGGSRNIRHTPGMKTDRLKDNTKGSDDKDGIKG
ncbi:hypothetical protein C5P18_26520 [Escherichia coli]|nr:DotA/TraY family protein [Escherichia coli]MCC4181234.1 DotA/TraY family protein [Escherichia coli]PPW53598.1 hypothetical protein C5P18_26520 [Escherichia coli]